MSSGILANLVAEHLPALASRHDADTLRPRVPYDFDATKQKPQSGVGEVADQRPTIDAGAEPVSPVTRIERHTVQPILDRTVAAEPREALANIVVARPQVAVPGVMQNAPRAIDARPAPEDPAPQKSRERVDPIPARVSLPPVKISTRHETVIERRVSADIEKSAPQGVRPSESRGSPPEPHGLRPRLESLPPPAPLRSRPAEPVIEIHIGRLEVRAAAQAVKSAPAPRASEPDRGLANYLRGRGSGARS